MFKLSFFILLSLFVFNDNLSYGKTLSQQIEARKAKSKIPENIRKEFQRATNELKSSGINQKKLKEGVKLPSFEINGRPVSKYYKNKLLVIKFYRGHWCPYCQMELTEYEKFYPEIKKHAEIVFLTPDQKKFIEKVKRKHKISMPIYTDKNNQIAKKLGIAFELDKEVSKLYKKFGIDLKGSQGNNDDELPLPGTYIINQKGMIVFASSDVDYTKRLDPEVLLREIQRVK